MYYIKSLNIENIERYYSIDGNKNKLDWIRDLSKINIFVGSNNSGKSRLLRSIFNINNFNFTSSHDLSILNNLISSLKQETETCINEFGMQDYNGYVASSKKINEINTIIEEKEYSKELIELMEKLAIQNDNGSIMSQNHFYNFYGYNDINTKLNEIGNKYKTEVIEALGKYPVKYTFHRLYIPTLRGLRPFYKEGLKEDESELLKDIYQARTRKDYFKDNSKGEIFSGLSLYEDLKDLLLGNLKEREIVSKFQKFLGDAFFDGQEIALIPSKNSDVVSVKIGDEDEKPIYELGDGIQSIIIITFPLFMNEGNKLIVFIEEPELYLHPGLQRKLMETLMNFEDYQYFITTHSNHFLDITLDIPQISIFTFKKELDEIDSREKQAKFIVENVSNDNSNVLELLGVKNSSMFLANCTIWVEGITDRYYIRKYLQVYQDSLPKGVTKYREDYHYAFIEYSGNNITHWSFLDNEAQEADEISKSMNAEKICGKLFLISDKDSDLKKVRQDKLTEKLGNRFCCLECKEIENLLTIDVLKRVVSDYEGKPAVFSKNISEADYKNKYIGKYIDTYLVDKKRIGKYSSESGTINNKVNFCEKALRHINSLEDMSEEAEKLAKRVYEFIKSNNE